MGETLRWSRAQDGAFWGVCKGLARALNLPVKFVRLFWILSILLGGAGLWLYLIFTIALPREDLVTDPYEPMILGVCAQLARRNHLEAATVRLTAILLTLIGVGTTVIAYVALYFWYGRSDDASTNNP